ncbi:hypothetical protein EIN43_09725 [Enterobacter hormaechei]|uniref:Uncharacterized protein n=1 Tax=Enterobacter hormaechei TaxID=158836 RepID=A0A4Y5ZP92_9ENTR|nr:hypothetical protein EIN43_09725 [Enterobacter hormaechei]
MGSASLCPSRRTRPAAIDWRTIISLSGLMMLTKGVELSGYFDVLGRKMVRRFATERKLALFMVFRRRCCRRFSLMTWRCLSWCRLRSRCVSCVKYRLPV